MADRRAVRLILSLTATGVSLPLWVVLAPVWAIVSVIADLIGGLRRLPSLRLSIFLLIFLIHDWFAVLAGLGIWISHRVGKAENPDLHRRIQGEWGSSLLRWAGRLLGLRLEFDDLSELPDSTFIILSRHASMIDAVIPVRLVTRDLGRFVHYVLKRELRWVPAMEIHGPPLGNYFVARGADTDVEAAAIEKMAVDARQNSALVIFPEGTYATPKTRARVLASLRRNGDAEVVAKAEALQTLLPPKPAGTLAMLRGQPEADVVVIGHVGLEGVAELKGLRQRLPLTDPVRVEWWVHPRSELPTSEEDLTDWLTDRWLELDQWVTQTLENRNR